MSKPVMAYKNLTSEVFHLPAPGQGPIFRPALCGTSISSASTVREFEDIKNPNVCRACALRFRYWGRCSDE